MAAPHAGRPQLWPEQWAVHAMVDADRLEHRMRLAQADASPHNRRARSEEAVAGHLAEVRAACQCGSKRPRRGLRDRWRGTSIERAYRNLHSAKVFAVDLLPDAEVAALVPDVSTRLCGVLDRNDPRRVGAEMSMGDPDPAVRRAAVSRAMETAYDGSDDRFVRLRGFRNIILLTAAALAVFTGLLVLAVMLSPDAIPLCFEPSVTTAAGASQEQVTNVCPSGDRQRPTSGDVVIVAGLGAVGGGLAALFAIRTLRGTSTPYDVPMALAVLKVPSGALTGVIGILLMAGGFIPGLSNLDNQRQILAYALVFGYAQQIITRLADDRAQTILQQIPSKDPEAPQPQARSVATPVTSAGPDPAGSGAARQAPPPSGDGTPNGRPDEPSRAVAVPVRTGPRGSARPGEPGEVG